MSVVLELEPEVEAALKKKAAASGSPVNSYVKKLIEQHIDLGPTYEESMAPLWKDFEESGMTDEELNSFVDDLREKVWQEKNKG